MRRTIPSTWIIGLGVAVLSLSIVERSRAHGDHHASPGLPSSFSSKPEASPTAVLPISVFTHSLGRCVWERTARDTATGGLVLECANDTAPINTAVYVASYNDPEHDHLVVLSPNVSEWAGVGVDGMVDGEGLADSHVHGESPPDATTVETFANTATQSGAGIHYVDTGPDASNHVLALCCESLENKPDLDELENCRYETELVAVESETHPDLTGQYVATLACSQGRVTSGGCFTQFQHSISDYGLTGSHPYVDGDAFQHPDGAHSSTTGETGWACRLDGEPELEFTTPDVAEIAITVLCCY
jgi:hypothetical protein